jgi:hypothetical protein
MMLGKVKPDNLLLQRYADRDEEVDCLANNECSGHAVSSHHEHGEALHQEQMGIAKEKAVRPRPIYRFGREEARRDHANDAAYAVHTEGIERIIVAEFWFQHTDAHEADDACGKAYGHGREHADKA